MDNTKTITDIASYVNRFGQPAYELQTVVLRHSMLIYAIVFCVKNYNAQMHNNIINTHKSNAFKSTLSLLNTARSDEGNDEECKQKPTQKKIHS
jgi:hypothetical protein